MEDWISSLVFICNLSIYEVIEFWLVFFVKYCVFDLFVDYFCFIIENVEG